jgi:hypothetical protein
MAAARSLPKARRRTSSRPRSDTGRLLKPVLARKNAGPKKKGREAAE